MRHCRRRRTPDAGLKAAPCERCAGNSRRSPPSSKASSPALGKSASRPGPGRSGVGAPGPSGRPPPGGGRDPQRAEPGGGLRRSDRRAQSHAVAADAGADAAMPYAFEAERRTATERQLHEGVTTGGTARSGSGEVSGVDLARVALRAAMEAARENGGGRTAKSKPRMVRTARRDGREPMGLGAAIGALVTVRPGSSRPSVARCVTGERPSLPPWPGTSPPSGTTRTPAGSPCVRSRRPGRRRRAWSRPASSRPPTKQGAGRAGSPGAPDRCCPGDRR